MNLQEFQNTKDNAYWKVLSSTFQPNSNSRSMVGNIFPQAIYNDEDKMIALKDKSVLTYFLREDLQRMTPVLFNGEKVGIGDYVNGFEILDYTFYNEQFVLIGAIDDYKQTAIIIEKEITEHTEMSTIENKIIVEIKANNLTLEQLKTKSLWELLSNETLTNSFNEKSADVLYKGDTKYSVTIDKEIVENIII